MQVTSTAAALGAGLAQSPARMSQDERAALYQRVLGAPGGASGGAPANREFNDLWMRFVSSVAQFGTRQGQVAPLLSVTPERLLADARGLAARLGPAVQAAAGSRDQWNVIDSVATAYLGGAAQTSRYRSLAESGGAILESLLGGERSFDQPAELQNNVEHWLAASMTRDDDVEALSQPDGARRRIEQWSSQLHEALGYAPGRPPEKVAALFTGDQAPNTAGPSGTGKTLAAHWLAAERGVDVMRIDLARVVSKYIGETEKNLSAVFGDAERSGALLLFDEADALFGKRTDVRDSHDRYANAETNYLLQRIEDHPGLVIVASNASRDIDPDVLKRLRHVAFPLPVPPRAA